MSANLAWHPAACIFPMMPDDNSIRKIICGQAKRMGVKATVTINERWVWICAVRIGQLIGGAK